MNTLYIILGVSAVLAIYVISLYNRLIALENNRENAFADIDVQLKQRHDLIPQLLNTVKGYMNHEDKVLLQVTEARTAASSARGVNEKIAAEAQLGAALSGLNIAVEAYPDLKANTNFLQLQSEISDIENKLAAARRFFNSSTKEFNNSVESFPANVFCKMFHFKEEPMFDLGETRSNLEQAPEITF